jgi:hypothetical protein
MPGNFMRQTPYENPLQTAERLRMKAQSVADDLGTLTVNSTRLDRFMRDIENQSDGTVTDRVHDGPEWWAE